MEITSLGVTHRQFRVTLAMSLDGEEGRCRSRALRVLVFRGPEMVGNHPKHEELLLAKEEEAQARQCPGNQVDKRVTRRRQ